MELESDTNSDTSESSTSSSSSGPEDTHMYKSKVESETSSSGSNSESTGSDWYDLDPIKPRKNCVHIKKKKVVSPIRKHHRNKLRNKAY